MEKNQSQVYFNSSIHPIIYSFSQFIHLSNEFIPYPIVLLLDYILYKNVFESLFRTATALLSTWCNNFHPFRFIMMLLLQLPLMLMMLLLKYTPKSICILPHPLLHGSTWYYWIFYVGFHRILERLLSDLNWNFLVSFFSYSFYFNFNFINIQSFAMELSF